MSCNRGQWSGGRWVRSAWVAGLLVVGLTCTSTNLVHAKGQGPAVTESTIAVSQLPPQGQDMMTLIVAGGPFQYGKDGVGFWNRERIFPSQNPGF